MRLRDRLDAVQLRLPRSIGHVTGRNQPHEAVSLGVIAGLLVPNAEDRVQKRVEAVSHCACPSVRRLEVVIRPFLAATITAAILPLRLRVPVVVHVFVVNIETAGLQGANVRRKFLRLQSVERLVGPAGAETAGEIRRQASKILLVLVGMSEATIDLTIRIGFPVIEDPSLIGRRPSFAGATEKLVRAQRVSGAVTPVEEVNSPLSRVLCQFLDQGVVPRRSVDRPTKALETNRVYLVEKTEIEFSFRSREVLLAAIAVVVCPAVDLIVEQPVRGDPVFKRGKIPNMARRDPDLLFPPIDQLDQRRGRIEEALITGSHQKHCIALRTDHIILFEIPGVIEDLTVRLVQQREIGPFFVVHQKDRGLRLFGHLVRMPGHRRDAGRSPQFLEPVENDFLGKILFE